MVEAAVCVRCREQKTADEFYANAKKLNGLDSWCKDCHSERRKERYHSDPDREREVNARWERANRDKVAAKSRRMYERHKERKLATTRAWHAANPERKRELWREWANKNPDRIRQRTLERAARKNNAAGTATDEQIAARVALFGGRCWMCGAPWNALDHVIPLAAGGSNWPANLRPACKPCNSRKRDRDWRKFVHRLFDRERGETGVQRCV